MNSGITRILQKKPITRNIQILTISNKRVPILVCSFLREVFLIEVRSSMGIGMHTFFDCQTCVRCEDDSIMSGGPVQAIPQLGLSIGREVIASCTQKYERRWGGVLIHLYQKNKDFIDPFFIKLDP